MIRSLIALVFFCLLAGCPKPLPPVNPPDLIDASRPHDIFTGSTIDCLPAPVRDRQIQATPHAENCLIKGDVVVCLVELTTLYGRDPVACAVRDRGAYANANVQVGDAGADESTIAREAKRFIRSEELGFR